MKGDPAEILADAVRARLEPGAPFLVALDYDGTLTEIVDDPADPALDAGRRGVLERVSAPNRRLAIVSGRALDDIRDRIGIEDAIYVGNHGLEIAGGGLAERLAVPGLEARLSALLESLGEDGWSMVENKALTATLHVRPRADPARHAALGDAIRGAVEAAGFDLRGGKDTWEIRPAGAATKGDAIRRLIAALPGVSPARTVYIGDDATDEDAFQALGEGITARVGPVEIATAARYRLPDPAAVYRFLDALIAGIPPGR
ncbi:MAG TPA: trehalose-phosphatase [Gemmatimonadota bacterium]|nr:trehalose-phosphatase [Gemmatimonadota bacterium]